MQWSPDRNAGFSRAQPERLYLPAISDAVYGYQAVNVEAQERSPFSLLNSTKRLIRVRKQHRAFGRGSITFLQPENPHVLAYLREYRGDVILVVNNLSGTAQAVRLELPGFAGYTPVELLGETAFLPVDETPYAITLSPYGFFWFALRQIRHAGEEDFWQFPEEWARQEEALVADDAAVAEVFGAIPREWLLRQRWFREKSREVAEICLHDHGVLRAERAPTVVLAVLEVRFAGGGSELYLLPATFHPVAAPGAGPEPIVTHATLVGEARVYEAVAERRIAGTLLDAVVSERRIHAMKGAFTGRRAAAVDLSDLPAGPVRLMGAEQSNTSLVFADRLVMKIFRRIEPGINPDLEVPRFLVERAGFRSTPALAGWLEWAPEGGEPHAVAGVFEYVPNQGDAWSVALRALERYLSAAARSAADPDTVAGREAVRRMAGDFFPALARLGETTGRMHLALAAVDDDPAFAPEPVTDEDVQRAVEAFRRQVDTVLGDLGRQLESIPGSFSASVQGPLREVVRAAPDLRHRGEYLRELSGATVKVRTHGDYHLGQVLRGANGDGDGAEWYVLDFEGEPARPLADRRAKKSVLRDVAGMLRSFNYAVRVAVHDFQTDDLRVRMALDRWAQAWEREARELFLGAYRRTVEGSPVVPRDPEVFDRALAVFELEKAVYELGYEMDNRPDWLWVPVEGIRAILRGHA
jgi:maltose alpha-D-glucosyltransferase/alpha-amylase